LKNALTFRDGGEGVFNAKARRRQVADLFSVVLVVKSLPRLPKAFEPIGNRREEFVPRQRNEGRIATERAGASESIGGHSRLLKAVEAYSNLLKGLFKKLFFLTPQLGPFNLQPATRFWTPLVIFGNHWSSLVTFGHTPGGGHPIFLPAMGFILHFYF
jgi:hypothetical protein